jgi:hypothetical protein
MKIEQPRTNVDAAVGPQGIDVPRQAPKAGGAAGLDRVRFSGDLLLANAAVKAAGTGTDVRPAAVAEAKALVASGALGNDLEHLADRMVKALTYSHDPDPS